MFRRKLLSFLPTLPTAVSIDMNPSDSRDVRAKWIPYSTSQLAEFQSLVTDLTECAANAKKECDSDRINQLPLSAQQGSRECLNQIAQNHLERANAFQAKLDTGGYWKKYIV